MELKSLVLGAGGTVVVAAGVFAALVVANAQDAPDPVPAPSVTVTVEPSVAPSATASATPTVAPAPEPSATTIPEVAVTPKAVVTPKPAPAGRAGAPTPAVVVSGEGAVNAPAAPGDIKNAGKIAGPTVLPDGSTASLSGP